MPSTLRPDMAAMKQKKTSGVNIEEWQRRTTAIKLRLPAAVAATVRERAAAKDMTLSAYVAELVSRDEPEQEPSAPVREARVIAKPSRTIDPATCR